MLACMSYGRIDHRVFPLCRGRPDDCFCCDSVVSFSPDAACAVLVVTGRMIGAVEVRTDVEGCLLTHSGTFLSVHRHVIRQYSAAAMLVMPLSVRRHSGGRRTGRNEPVGRCDHAVRLCRAAGTGFPEAAGQVFPRRPDRFSRGGRAGFHEVTGTGFPEAGGQVFPKRPDRFSRGGRTGFPEAAGQVFPKRPDRFSRGGRNRFSRGDRNRFSRRRGFNSVPDHI
jgi:hypothetical protein